MIPGNNITFVIVKLSGEQKTCTAEDGMTWGEWIDSEYNTMGARGETGYVYIGAGRVTSQDGHGVIPEDEIIPNEIYELVDE